MNETPICVWPATEQFATSDSSQQDKNNSDPSDENKENLIEGLGRCKWFDIAKGYGFITRENENADVFAHKSAIQTSAYPCLHEGEKVRVWYKPSEQGFKAVKVCGPSGEDLTGCPPEEVQKIKKPHRRKCPERCYNCGEIGHHAKQCDYPPLPKRCHHCKCVDHLVAHCPLVASSGQAAAVLRTIEEQVSSVTSSGQMITTMSASEQNSMVTSNQQKNAEFVSPVVTYSKQANAVHFPGGSSTL